MLSLIQMFLIMGFVHIVASGILLLAGSEPTIYLSQMICGLVEFSIGLYLFMSNDCQFSIANQ